MNIKRTRACTSVSTKYMRRMLLHGRDAHFFNYKTAKALLQNAPMQKFTKKRSNWTEDGTVVSQKPLLEGGMRWGGSSWGRSFPGGQMSLNKRQGCNLRHYSLFSLMSSKLTSFTLFLIFEILFIIYVKFTGLLSSLVSCYDNHYHHWYHATLIMIITSW